jgi:chromosome segregation ATPase
MQKTLQA